MKNHIPFTDTMDALRPHPARREAMLQNILNSRHAGVSRRRRWAWAALPAVAVLALTLVWSGGVFGTDRVAAPDIVTQAAGTVTPSVMPTASAKNHADTGEVQWLTHVTPASADVAKGLPDKLALLRTTPVELSTQDMDAITVALQAKGWTAVKLHRVVAGGYSLYADSAQPPGSTTDRRLSLLQDSGLPALLKAKKIDMPLASADKNLILYVPALGDGALPAPGCIQISQTSSGTVALDMRLRSNELLGSADAMPLEQALRHAFFVPDGGDPVNPDAPIAANPVSLFYFAGVPYYGFPVSNEPGIARMAYALAVDEANLAAVPDLAAAYQRFLAGEQQDAQRIIGYPVTAPASIQGNTQKLTNVTLASPDVANNLPDRLELVRSKQVLLSAKDIASIENALKAKTWDTVQMLGISDGYYKLSAHKKTSANQTAMDTFVQDSGLYHLAERRGIRLSSDQPRDYSGLRLTLQPSSDPISISSAINQNSINTETIIAFWQDEILGNVTVLPPDQALRKAFYILGGHPALDADAALPVNTVNFVCVSGVPCYQFPVETANGTRYGYALAVDEKDLNAIPELAATYQRFLNGETMQIDVILQSPTDVSDLNTNK